MKKHPRSGSIHSAPERRGLKVHEWPEAERLAWVAACKPSHRLKKGGSASQLASVTQEDYARRYGLFLGFLKLTGRLNLGAPAAAQVTPENVKAYLDDLAVRVTSVTAWNNISKLRRAAQLIAPAADFSWLQEIVNDLAFLMEV